MGLTSALVDTAHTFAREATGVRQGGETQQVDVTGTSFKCRVSSPQPDELRRDRIRFTEYVRDLTMLVGMKDIDGELVAISAKHTIIVEDGAYAGTYNVMGQPSPIRKKRAQIGWVVALKEQLGKEA